MDHGKKIFHIVLVNFLRCNDRDFYIWRNEHTGIYLGFLFCQPMHALHLKWLPYINPGVISLKIYITQDFRTNENILRLSKLPRSYHHKISHSIAVLTCAKNCGNMMVKNWNIGKHYFSHFRILSQRSWVRLFLSLIMARSALFSSPFPHFDVVYLGWLACCLLTHWCLENM